MRTSPGERLRGQLRVGRVVAPFVFDGLQARCAQRAGFAAVYLTGFGAAAARGLPDLGLLGMSDMAGVVSIVAAATALPVVADADTGYGGVLNVARTVAAYEAAGVAGLHIEDQVWPKRCGFFEGKEVVAASEMAAKVRAACDARSNPTTVIVARTDALATGGWDDAEHRARLYSASGADLVFVDGIRTAADLAEYERRLGDLALVYNGTSPPQPTRDGRGVALQLDGTSFAVVVEAVRDIFARMGGGDARLATADFATLRDLLGVDTGMATVARYETLADAAIEAAGPP